MTEPYWWRHRNVFRMPPFPCPCCTGWKWRKSICLKCHERNCPPLSGLRRQWPPFVRLIVGLCPDCTGKVVEAVDRQFERALFGERYGE